MKEFLQRVKNRLTKGWTRKAFARNSFGTSVGIRSSEACEFCLSGAAMLETQDMDLLCRFERLFPGGPVLFNDSHNKEEVLAKLDESMAAL